MSLTLRKYNKISVYMCVCVGGLCKHSFYFSQTLCVSNISEEGKKSKGKICLYGDDPPKGGVFLN